MQVWNEMRVSKELLTFIKSPLSSLIFIAKTTFGDLEHGWVVFEKNGRKTTFLLLDVKLLLFIINFWIIFTYLKWSRDM